MGTYLLVTGIIFILVGVRALFQPIEAVAIPFELKADGPNAMSYLRSGTGGVSLARGAVMLWGFAVSAIAFAATLMAVTILGGLVFGRIVSGALDGNPGLVPWISGSLELLGFLSGLFWLFQ